MSLKFIIGGAGTGKSYTAYENVIREAESRPDVLYYIIVPEQFTMQTQKNVVSMSSRGGILNIDVLSFQRLAYRVFEETGGDTLALLDDIGKSMILRKLTEERESDYPYLGNQIRKPGCLDEVKSLISEFMQYDISPEEVARMAESAGERTLVIGSRNLTAEGMPSGNTFANKFSNFWFTVQTGRKLPDTQTGFRVYPLEDLPSLKLLTARYEAELALLVFSAWKNLRIVPVPVRVYYPEDRVSHFRPFADFFRISVLNTVLCVLALVYGYPRMLLGR